MKQHNIKLFLFVFICILLLLGICIFLKIQIQNSHKDVKLDTIETGTIKYTPISETKSKAFKADLEYIIDSEYNNVVKNADHCVKDIKNIYTTIVNNGYNNELYNDMVQITEIAVLASDLDLYVKLMKTTQEKYLNIPYQPIGTDISHALYDYMYPYFIRYNINTKKLEELEEYINKQYKICKQYVDKVEKLNKN